jgi:hypothetical protein
MTIKELKEILKQYDDSTEITELDELGLITKDDINEYLREKELAHLDFIEELEERQSYTDNVICGAYNPHLENW